MLGGHVENSYILMAIVAEEQHSDALAWFHKIVGKVRHVHATIEVPST
jgi:hypothetical protein